MSTRHPPTDTRRRELLHRALAAALSGGVLLPHDVFGRELYAFEKDWNGRIYAAKRVDYLIRAMGDEERYQPSNQVRIEAPQLVEDGALVPVSMESRIPGTDYLALFCEANPYPVCVGFHVLPGTLPALSTRIKVAQYSQVMALARTPNGWFYAETFVDVTIGGCQR